MFGTNGQIYLQYQKIILSTVLLVAIFSFAVPVILDLQNIFLHPLSCCFCNILTIKYILFLLQAVLQTFVSKPKTEKKVYLVLVIRHILL